jgi:hypothetical protein
MTRAIVRLMVALGLVAAGWSIGRAQNAQPDFILVVDGPVGTTNVQCKSGCELVFGRSADNPRAMHMPTFTYTCTGGVRCSSGEIAGWVKR